MVVYVDVMEAYTKYISKFGADQYFMDFFDTESEKKLDLKYKVINECIKDNTLIENHPESDDVLELFPKDATFWDITRNDEI